MTQTASAWITSESGFPSFDKTRIFYRAWQPVAKPAGQRRKALVFLHRGHEHSGRIQALVEQFAYTHDWAFAWDARGHGHSPGERGDAPSFYTLVQDLDAFIRHLQAQYSLEAQDIVLVANSVGAVIAATWLHDYAVRVRGVVMAAAAFDINLYVPLAKPALRLAMRFNPALTVTSYIRSSMLTHSKAQADAYDADPLITRNISARVLLDLADVAQRVLADAQAIDTPVLMLVADKDYVVKQAPQRLFFDRLASGLKQFVVIPNCHHAVLYEDTAQTQQALEACRAFIDTCFSYSLAPLASYHNADTVGPGALQYQSLKAGTAGGLLENLFYGLQKRMLGTLGHLSDGMRIGMAHGFDSGASLDYVYCNQASGRLGVGKFIDRGYLDAIGWRGIRQRKAHLQQLLCDLIDQHPAGQTLRILDIAAGEGRYVLETLKRFQNRKIEVVLRDAEPGNLAQAEQLARKLALNHTITYQCRDAFDTNSYPAEEEPIDLVIVSGLFELFSDNATVLRALQGIATQLKAKGHLIYTGQPWHPQLLLIAKTLNNHKGQPWLMRPRPQVEMDALVGSIGCQKVRSEIGIAGIFTVSVAYRVDAAQRAVG